MSSMPSAIVSSWGEYCYDWMDVDNSTESSVPSSQAEQESTYPLIVTTGFGLWLTLYNTAEVDGRLEFGHGASPEEDGNVWTVIFTPCAPINMA